MKTWLKNYFEEKKNLHRERKFESGKNHLLNICKSFYNDEDMKIALFQTLISFCTEEECEELSKRFGRHAHDKGRWKLNRET